MRTLSFQKALNKDNKTMQVIFKYIMCRQFYKHNLKIKAKIIPLSFLTSEAVFKYVVTSHKCQDWFCSLLLDISVRNCIQNKSEVRYIQEHVCMVLSHLRPRKMNKYLLSLLRYPFSTCSIADVFVSFFF